MSGSREASRLPSLSRMDSCSIANCGSRIVRGIRRSSILILRSVASESGYPRAMRVRVRVPATSANLGPGFDALGLALSLYNDVTVEESDRVSVTVEGEGAGQLSTGAGNVVARGVQMAFSAAGRRFGGATIQCVNRIPLARGLGSSAAAWVGGLVGGNALLGGPLNRDGLLTLAARADGHPDNVAPAILGGLTVACETDERVVA